MKKFYNSPSVRIISLENEDAILSASDTQNNINIGVGQGTEKGSNALGNKKDMWGSESIWE